MNLHEGPLKIVLADATAFRRFAKRLDPIQVRLVQDSIDNILAIHGLSLLAEGDWLKSLGAGLFEFRIGPTTSSVYSQIIRNSPEYLKPSHRKMLIRIFVSFEGLNLVIICGAYDKLDDSSKRRQQLEVVKARKALRLYLAGH